MGTFYLLQRSRWGVINTWSSLTNHYSQHYAPIVTEETATEHASFTALAVSQRVDLVEVDYVLHGTPLYEQLTFDLRSSKFHAVVEKRYGNWVLPTSNCSFDEYMQSRSSQLRNTIVRSTKKLTKLGAVEFVIHSGQDETLAAAINEYHRIYNLSWKSAESNEAFVTRLIQLCATTGELRLGMLRLDGRVIATQFWIVSDTTAYIYKLAYDPEYRRYSVGTLLTRHLVEHVFNEVLLIDYGIGDEAYKADWMTERRQYVRICAANTNTVAGWLITRFWRGRDLVKALLGR